MNWNSILKLKCWTPFEYFREDAKLIDNDLYQINHEAFILVKPYNKNGEKGLSQAPFITRAYWAPSPVAVRRLAFHDSRIEVNSNINPPQQLLLGSDGSYKSLLKIAKEKYKDDYEERATYFGATDALFVHKEILIDRFVFCFLENEIIDEEMVYGIDIRLLK